MSETRIPVRLSHPKAEAFVFDFIAESTAPRPSISGRMASCGRNSRVPLVVFR